MLLKKPHLLGCLKRLLNSSKRTHQIGQQPRRNYSAQTSDENVEVTPAPSRQEIADIAKQIPIEKRSMARGFAVNKFEKDFIIYPEYEHSKDIDRIRGFVKRLGNDLEKALSQSDAPNGLMPSKVKEALVDGSVFASIVPKEFGGREINQKDLLQVAECLGGLDLSTFTSFNHIMNASNFINQFGTQEQKQRYLPGIAVGKWRPTICWQEDTTGFEPTAQVFDAHGQGQRLNAVKANVEGAMEANLFIVFANQKIGDLIIPSCYILERDPEDPSIQAKDQIRISGLLNCNFSTVTFDNFPVDDSLRLGQDDPEMDCKTMMEELPITGKSLYGAAVVGFLKKVLGELCTFANLEVKGHLRLSDTHPAQKEIYQLGILLYVVESMSYYVAGLTDEGLFLSQDIENSIIQRYSNRALRQALLTITEVTGICAVDAELPFDKMIRDTIALMTLSEPDLQLIRRISLPAIEYYVAHHGGIKKFMRTSTLKKLMTSDSDLQAFLNPRLVYFIAEHVHPSLLESAQAFEYSLSRLDKIIDALVKRSGVYINTDYVALEDVSTLMENNLAMVASLARASRSYSIGVRNSDLEVEWTRFFCKRAGDLSKRIIIDLMEGKKHILNSNPRLTGGALDLLTANGYCLESPIEKNW